MSECIHEKYLHNGEIKYSIDFSDKMVNRGLSVYEVIRIIQSKYLFLQDHILRLKASLHLLKHIYISDIKIITNYLLKYKLITDISNGLNELPQIFVYQIKHNYPNSEYYDKGIMVSLLSGKRNKPNAKFINLQINKLVAEEFYQKSIYETLFIDKKGNITEGSKSNLFFVKDNSVFTAPDKSVLLGITRKHVIELCRELGITVKKTNIHVDSLEDYDAAFITGTSVKILPVKQINKYRFDVKNQTMIRLMEKFEIKITKYLAGTDEISNDIV
jgi:branched-chain amino acid aminotransferase